MAKKSINVGAGGYYLGGLEVPPDADFIAVAYPTSSTEQYTYKKGGESGTVLRIVTVNYTDSTKTKILNVSWGNT